MARKLPTPDPIFAAIRAHKVASAACDSIREKCNALDDKIATAEKHFPAAAVRAGRFPTYWLGNAYKIENKRHAKRHLDELFVSILPSRVGPKTLAKMKRLRAFALKEIVAAFENYRAACAAKRAETGIDALDALRSEAYRVEKAAFKSLIKTRARTAHGIVALIQYAQDVTCTGPNGDYESGMLIKAVGASLKALLRQ